MSGDRDRRATLDGLEFFGAIAASVTHEMNNVLSILDQAGGLLGDLAAGAGRGRPVDPARLETVHERIDRQVRKGVEIVNRLNRFAHSLDEGASSFEVAEQAGNLIALARRFADLKKVRLDFAVREYELQVNGSAFAMQHGLFLCLRAALDASGEGDRIDVEVGRDDGFAVVAVSAAAGERGGDGDSLGERLATLLEPLGGEHRERPAGEGRTTLEIRLPLAGGG